MERYLVALVGGLLGGLVYLLIIAMEDKRKKK